MITNEFLAKLKRATSVKPATKIVTKPGKHVTIPTIQEEPPAPRRRRSLKAIAIAAAATVKERRR